jgi:hypothetical protein
MNDSSIPQKVADSAVFLTWIGWIASHVKEINEWLQLVALLLAIVASWCAIRFHSRPERK